MNIDTLYRTISHMADLMAMRLKMLESKNTDLIYIANNKPADLVKTLPRRAKLEDLGIIED